MKRQKTAAPADTPEDLAAAIREALAPLWEFFPKADAAAVVVSPGGGVADIVIPISVGRGHRIPGSICPESYVWERQ